MRILFAAAAVALAAYAPLFAKIGVPFGKDWGYFNALSLVVRSTVLHYRRFPVQNPWVCGGLDLLANPQSRIFSPFLLVDLAFTPQWANLISLVAYAVIGFVGAQKLLSHLGVSPVITLIGAALYINGTWFGLHYAEGHIPYGAMQLLPLMMYLALRCGSRRPRILLGAGAALLLLDGQMYVFIYSIYLILSCILLGLVPAAQLRAALTQRPVELLAILLGAVLLALPKVLPVLSGIGDRVPYIDFYQIPTDLVAQALFVPFHTNLERPGGMPWNFHEFSCYLSPLALMLVVCGGFSPRDYWQRAWPFLVGALFWFWVGSGWLPDLNPWLWLQKIPLLNNAHVQSRALLLMFLFYVILVSLALTRLRAVGTLAVVCVSVFLLAESVAARTFPMQMTPLSKEEAPATRLITTTTITKTKAIAWQPSHYYEGAGTAKCYEPSFTSGLIAASDTAAYRGEAYVLGDAAGTAHVTKYTPGRIALDYRLERPGTIELNTNALFGWQVRDPADGVTRGRGTELLRVEPTARAGTLQLHYWPPYMTLLFGSLAAGVVLFGTLFWRTRKPHMQSENDSKDKSESVTKAKFDYSKFPTGYYHEVLQTGSPVRRAWHLQKFNRVIDCLPARDGLSLLDIGCFAGTFLSMLDERRFPHQVGVDVLASQIEYANQHFATAHRRFQHITSLDALDARNLGSERFDAITLIEVIEHLEQAEVALLLGKTAELLNDGGTLIITTPNYTSTWPLLELLINRLSEVSYEEQHITKFHYYGVLRKLQRIAPTFLDNFELEFRTTTHFISPFLAQISPTLAARSSNALRHQNWPFPLGNLILMSFRRKKRAQPVEAVASAATSALTY